MRNKIDIRLFLILIGFMGAYHIVYILRRVVLKAMERSEYSDVSWWVTILEPVLSNFVIVVPVVTLILWVTQTLIDKGLKWVYIVIIHFILSFVYSIVVTAFGFLYMFMFYDQVGQELSFELFITMMLFKSNLNFLGYLGFITIIYSYTYLQKINKSEVQKLQLQQHLQAARLDLLKSQLNPHFLFNTLNSITSLIKIDSYKAQEMIGNLGDLLREVLLIQEEVMIPVQKEMKIVTKYVEIMQHRFSNSLSIEMRIADNAKDSMVPSLLLQPIMENSIKHGHLLDTTCLKIVLNIVKKGEKLVIEIKNNGAFISKEYNEQGLGIKNIQDRLNVLYEYNSYFSFSNLENERGVVTKIEIPYLHK